MKYPTEIHRPQLNFLLAKHSTASYSRTVSVLRPKSIPINLEKRQPVIRPLLKTLAIVAVVSPFLFASSAMSATVIDSFDLNSLTLTTSGSSQQQAVTVAGDAAIRTLSLTSSGQMAQVVVDAGQFGFASLSASDVGKTEYSDFTLDASATPYLRFTIGTTLGGGQAEIGLTSSSGGGPIVLLAPIPAGIGSPTDLHFDLRTFPGYQPGFLTGVVSLAIAFTGNSSAEYFLKVNEIALATEPEFLASVPEPTMIALVLPAALLCSVRRRSRAALR